MTKLGTFGEDLRFLKSNVETIVLGEPDGQQVVVVPEWQGRTMTSTTSGDDGFSFGWVNYDRIESGKIQPQINLFGGEDRFWVSPEGSQYSLFFDPGAEMTLPNWRTPREIDLDPFQVVSQSSDQVAFQKEMSLVNYSGSEFQMKVDRTVQLHRPASIEGFLQMAVPDGVRFVCHESRNQVTNIGDSAWNPEGGLPAVWILCMNKPSPTATVVVPFRPGEESEMGTIVTSDYFGQLDASRLQVCEATRLIYFLGDGQYRSKLGVSQRRAVNFLGAWDSANQCLTIVQFNLPEQAVSGYTNNLWKHVANPYDGDVINSYNDGPNELGEMMGPFYELETLSPALALGVNESWCHVHRTIHLDGRRGGLDQVAQRVFGVSLETIESAFGGR